MTKQEILHQLQVGLISQGEYDRLMRTLESHPDWESDCGKLAEALEGMVKWARKALLSTRNAPEWVARDEDGDTLLDMFTGVLVQAKNALQETDHRG